MLADLCLQTRWSQERKKDIEGQKGEITRLELDIAERAALTQQLQSLDNVLDVSVQTYLRGMSQRARDNLRWSIYHFAKAYQYEYLTGVPDDFFNFDNWFDKLR